MICVPQVLYTFALSSALLDQQLEGGAVKRHVSGTQIGANVSKSVPSPGERALVLLSKAEVASEGRLEAN